VAAPVRSREDLRRLSVGLLEAATPLPKAARLLGVSLSSLQNGADTEDQFDLPI
jgi:DNA polymerase IV